MTLFPFTLVVAATMGQSKTLSKYVYFVARISQVLLREKHIFLTWLTLLLSITNMIIEMTG